MTVGRWLVVRVAFSSVGEISINYEYVSAGIILLIMMYSRY